MIRRSLSLSLWIAAGLGMGIVAIVAVTAAGPFIRGSAYANANQPPEVTILPPIFPTETAPMPTAAPSPTATATPVPPPLSQEGFGAGILVSVYGTEGEGLRLRNQPGLSSTVAFLAMENEVLEIGSGPREQDGYVWWYVFNPYDPTKAGWAVANHLRVVEAP